MNHKKDYLKPVVKCVAFKIEMGAAMSDVLTSNFQNGGSWDGSIYDNTSNSSSGDNEGESYF